MTIEELNELKKIVDDAVISSYADFTLEEGYNLVCLIEAEQQRRSVKSEDVQEALHFIEGSFGDVPFWSKARKQAILSALQQMQPVSGDTSDGYHTFNELYHHRAILFSILCKAYPDKAWRSKKHSDGSMFGDNWFICGIETPQGQYSYHYELSKYWDIFESCKTLEFAPEWDGHEPKDVDRLLSLQQMQKEPCEYCELEPTEKIYAYGMAFKKIPINYCPNCSRKLR